MGKRKKNKQTIKYYEMGKGFGPPKMVKTKAKKHLQNIAQRMKAVDAQTASNQQNPQALAQFEQLLATGNRNQIALHFRQYGISPELALANLDSLIAEELRDLQG